MELKMNPATGESRGFAFITFSDEAPVKFVGLPEDSPRAAAVWRRGMWPGDLLVLAQVESGAFFGCSLRLKLMSHGKFVDHPYCQKVGSDHLEAARFWMVFGCFWYLKSPVSTLNCCALALDRVILTRECNGAVCKSRILCNLTEGPLLNQSGASWILKWLERTMMIDCHSTYRENTGQQWWQ